MVKEGMSLNCNLNIGFAAKYLQWLALSLMPHSHRPHDMYIPTEDRENPVSIDSDKPMSFKVKICSLKVRLFIDNNLYASTRSTENRSSVLFDKKMEMAK